MGVTSRRMAVSVVGTVLPQPVRSQHVKVDATGMLHTYIAVGVVLCTTMLRAQAPATYCDVTSAMAYTLKMPGISRFQLNDIDRGSLAVECGVVMCNSYVMTGVSTSLEQGKAYTVSITHTRDDDFFPDTRNNLRVWIDWDQDATFNEASETAVLVNYAEIGTTTATFIVPANAKLGTTRLRATAKMSDDAGHSIPTPCDVPADPIGYHGEIEDYEVNVVTPTTSVTEAPAHVLAHQVLPNPFTQDATIVIDGEAAKIEIVDMMGRIVYMANHPSMQTAVNRGVWPTGRYDVRIYSLDGRIDHLPMIVVD